MNKTCASAPFQSLATAVAAAIQEGRVETKNSSVLSGLNEDARLKGPFNRLLKAAAGEVFLAGQVTPKKSSVSTAASTPVKPPVQTAAAGSQTEDLLVAGEELDDCQDHLSLLRQQTPEPPAPDTARIKELETELKGERKEIRRLKRSLENSKRKAENAVKRATTADARVRTLESKTKELGEEMKEAEEARDQAERARESAEQRVAEHEYEANEAANEAANALEAAPRGRLATNRRHPPQPTPEPHRPGASRARSRESTNEPMIEESAEPDPPPRPRKRQRAARRTPAAPQRKIKNTGGPGRKNTGVKKKDAKKKSGKKAANKKKAKAKAKAKAKGRSRKRKRDEPIEYLSHEYMRKIVKKKIRVFWPLDNDWFIGKCTSYRKNRAAGKTMHIHYEDGDKEWLNLQEEDFEVIDPPEGLPVNPNPRRKRRRTESPGPPTARALPNPRRKRRRTEPDPPNARALPPNVDAPHRRELDSEDTNSELEDNVADPKDRAPRGPLGEPDPGEAYEQAQLELEQQEASRGDVVSALMGQSRSEFEEEPNEEEDAPLADEPADNPNRRKGKKEGPMEAEDLDRKRELLKEDMHVEVFYDGTQYDGVILGSQERSGEMFYNVEIIALKPQGEDQSQVWLSAADITMHEVSEGNKGIEINTEVQAADGSCWFDGICQEILQGVDGPVYKIMFPDYNSFEWLPEDRVRKRQDQNLGR